MHPPDEEAGCDDIIVNVDEADDAEDGAPDEAPEPSPSSALVAPPVSALVVTPLPTAQGLTTKAAKALQKAENSANAALVADAAASELELSKAGKADDSLPNSTSHKREYKKFYLECRNRKKFPASLATEATRDSMNLFKIWLDKGGSRSNISACNLTISMSAGIGDTVAHISALSEMPKFMHNIVWLRPCRQSAQMFVRLRRLDQSCR